MATRDSFYATGAGRSSGSASSNSVDSRPGIWNRPETLPLADIDIDRVISQLSPENVELAYSQLQSYFKKGDPSKKFDKAGFMSYLGELLSAQQAQTHKEMREDTSYSRLVNEMQANGINTDLNPPGSAGESSPSEPMPTGDFSSTPAGSAGNGLSTLDSVGNILRFGASLLALFKTGSLAVGAVQSLFPGSILRGQSFDPKQAISEVPGLVDSIANGAMSADEISGKVLDRLFGSSDGVPGVYAGLSRKQMMKAREFTQRAIGDYLHSDEYQTTSFERSAGLSDAERKARESGYNNAVDLESGVHDIGGAIFAAEVDGVRKIKLNEIAIAVNNSECQRVISEYDLKFHQDLDAVIAARAQNEQNRMVAEESGYKADFSAGLSGADDASAQNTLRDNNVLRDRLETEYLELKHKGDMLKANTDIIVAEAQFNMVQSINAVHHFGEIRYSFDNPPKQVRDHMTDLVSSRSRNEALYNALMKSLNTDSSFRVGISGIGSVSYKN